jgi:SAM-dependent methyltransferase
MSETNAEQRDYWNSDNVREWIAEPQRYDEMLGPFVDPILDAAAVGATSRVLDVGCGNGALTVAAARRATEGSSKGVDLSEGMVANAQERSGTIDNVEFAVGDAQLPVAGTFDAIVSRFGIMFFEEPATAWQHLVAALAPGGRLAFACWRPPEENEWVAVQVQAILRHVPPPDDGDADGPGPFRYGDPAPLVDGLRAAGLDGVDASPFDASILLGGHGTLDEAIEFISHSGMTRRFLGEAPSDVCEAALAEVRSALEPYVTPDGVRLGAAVWIVSGTRR